MFGDTVKWQKELDRLATLYDTSQEGGLHAIMEGKSFARANHCRARPDSIEAFEPADSACRVAQRLRQTRTDSV